MVGSYDNNFYAIDSSGDNVKGLIKSKWDDYVQYNEDTLIDAGIWTEDTYADLSEGDGDTLRLMTNGNNDEAIDDWYVPEFSTIVMPIASVLLIVGYSYRKRNNLESEN